MKITVDTNLALRLMQKYDRNYYSEEAMENILDYYDGCEQDLEFDPIGIACEWTEYGAPVDGAHHLSFRDLFSDYGYLIEIEGALEDNLDSLVGELESHTTVIRLQNGNILVQEF